MLEEEMRWMLEGVAIIAAMAQDAAKRVSKVALVHRRILSLCDILTFE